MKKILRFLLICIAGVLLLAYLGSSEEEGQGESKETTQAAPATVRPNVEFSYGFSYVKLRVYSCKPCSAEQADKAANLLAESGQVTFHAFFDMDDASFAALESEISACNNFVEAEQKINAANPTQVRRVMANGSMMNQ